MSWEAVAGFSSATIALCALGLTIWQACIQRRHNKLSVTPYLTTWSQNNFGYHRYQVQIMNNGVGPALIKKFQIYVDAQQVQGLHLELIRKSIKLLFPNYPYNLENSYLSDGYMMSPKEVRDLVVIQFLGPNLPAPEEIEHASKRIRILIEYESIYKEVFVYDSSAFKVMN